MSSTPASFILYPFSGKTALITGAASGIGRATAELFIRSGAAVVLADIASDAGETLASELRARGGAATFVRTDVTDASSLQHLVQETQRLHGRVDFFFNNAGVEGAFAATADYETSTWERVVAVNQTGAWLAMKAVLPMMLSQGNGAIVNTASVGGLAGVPCDSAYAASKHAIVGITRSSALEYATKGIRINAICPGVTNTEMVARLSRHRPDQFAAMLPPLGRIAEPSEIGEAVLWLCSDGASFVTGHTLVIDGGILAS